MNERTLLAILTAIIWSQQRADLADPDVPDDERDLDSIREAVQFANDIVVEVDKLLEPEARRAVVDAEFVDEDERPARRRR